MWLGVLRGPRDNAADKDNATRCLLVGELQYLRAFSLILATPRRK